MNTTFSSVEAAILASGVFVLALNADQFDSFRRAVSKRAGIPIKMERVHCAERLHGVYAKKVLLIALPDWRRNFSRAMQLEQWWKHGLGGTIHNVTEEEFLDLTS